MIHSIDILTSRDGMRTEGNEIIREMIPEENCNTFTNLEGYGRTKKRGDGHGSPRGLIGLRRAAQSNWFAYQCL